MPCTVGAPTGGQHRGATASTQQAANRSAVRTVQHVLTHVMATEALPEECGATLFLAGPTPRDEITAPWRPAALELLDAAGFDGVVLDPERRSGWAGDYDDQVAWETNALAAADVIMFWVPRELQWMPAFTTNAELGMWVRSGRVVFGSPPDAPKNRYLRWWCQQLGVPLHDTLEGTVTSATAALEGRGCAVALSSHHHPSSLRGVNRTAGQPVAVSRRHSTIRVHGPPDPVARDPVRPGPRRGTGARGCLHVHPGPERRT